MPRRTNKKPAKRDNVVFRRIKGENLLLPISRFDDYRLVLFSLSDVGRAIWELINGSRTCEEISEALTKDYNVSKETARKDVKKFISLLSKKKLISF